MLSYASPKSMKDTHPIRAKCECMKLYPGPMVIRTPRIVLKARYTRLVFMKSLANLFIIVFSI
jgi:hypothetical protein